MSLLDTASLIVTPNGYKEGKLYSVIPSDGSGDLSVTRATTATRVNSAGLVELVPYNLIWYSEQFDNVSYWGLEQISVTANSTTAPNGTTTADTITDSSTFGYTYQSVPISGGVGSIVTHSVFLKRTNNDWVNVAASRTPGTTYGEFGVWFNLATGAIGSNFQAGVGVVVDSEITDEGNGWYRCSVTGYVPNAVGYVPYVFNSNADNSFTSSSGKSRYQWGAQLVEGSVAKDYQKTETRLNIPRLDYSNGTCPSILVEPQRTNLVTYSSSFDNAAWSKVGGVTVTANTTISPSGVQDADTINFSASSQELTQFISPIVALSGTYTHSFWIKGTAGQKVNYYDGTGDTLITLTSEWERVVITKTYASQFLVMNFNSYGGWTATSPVYIWGAQLEAGSYATSYIPTTSASVTRNADVISKTGISSLIGQTEGTLFVEAIVLAHQDNNTILSVNDGTLNEYMVISGNGSGQVNAFILDSGNVSSIISGTYAVGTTLKCALAYKTNDVAYYINGVQIGTDTSVTIPTASQVNIGSLNFLTAQLQGNIKAAALWKTRLTNTQLAQLTTI